MRIIFTILPITIFLSMLACAPLAPHDSAWGTAGEIAGRTLLGIGTLGTSELMFHGQYKMDQDAKAYQEWAQTLTPEQRLREQENALQALGFALSSGGPMRFMPAPMQPILPLMNAPLQNQRMRTICSSQQIGNQIFTNCQ